KWHDQQTHSGRGSEGAVEPPDHRALFNLHATCCELAASLCDVELAIRELAAAWFVASDAVKAAELHAAQHPGLPALQAIHRLLLDLFDLSPLGVAPAEVHRLRAELCQISAQISEAIVALTYGIPPRPSNGGYA